VTTRTIRRFAAAVLALVCALSMAACTKSTPTSHTSVVTNTQTITQSPSSIGPTGPVSTGTISEKKVSTCPYVSLDEAKADAGMRLDKIVTLLQDGKVVGCRFYPAVFKTENLPPTTQLAVEILIQQYASPDAAHNAFITIAEAGTNYQQEDVASGNTGLCYQTTVWAHDAGKDWACTFSKGSTVVVIRTVVTSPALNVVEIAKAVYPKV
jgi:hypothetical protein